eukprot:gene32636-42270_t
MADVLSANPVLSDDILREAVPGNIRKAEHFVTFLKKIVVYLKKVLQRFTYTRLNSLLRTLEVTSLEDYTALLDVANFATLLATYMEGFAVIIEPVIERFQSVVITSGTLSPIDLYPKLLNFNPVIRLSLPMSTFRPCLLPLLVTRGSDQIAISTRFELRKDTAVIRNYGQLLIETAAVTPDGICCFFTSYQYMEFVIGEWDKMDILKDVMAHKLLYLETKDVVETTLALDNFKRACDCGRGAVFLSVARGKVAEGIDFDRHYGRCVILFGIPYQYTLSHVLRARLNFMREKYNIRDNDFLTFDAVRQAAQCMGRTDYGIVILADSRYNRADKRSKLPPWIVQFIRESSLNLSTDLAMDQMKQFLKVAGQPIDQQALQTILFDKDQVVGLAQQFQHLVTSQPFSVAVAVAVPVAATNVTSLQKSMAPPLPPPPPSSSSSQLPVAVTVAVSAETSTSMAVVPEEPEERLESLYQEEIDNILGTSSSSSRMDVSGPVALGIAEAARIFRPPEYPTSLFLFEDILDSDDI